MLIVDINLLRAVAKHNSGGQAHRTSPRTRAWSRWVVKVRGAFQLLRQHSIGSENEEAQLFAERFASDARHRVGIRPDAG